MQIAKHRLEVDHGFAVQLDIHPKHAVRTRVVWPHRDFQQAGLQTILLNQLVVGRSSSHFMKHTRLAKRVQL